MSKLYLKDIKFIILTSELRDAVLSKSLNQIKQTLETYTGDANLIKVIEIDNYIDLDSTIENIDSIGKLVGGTTIAVTVLNNVLYMKKFHNSVLHNVMKFIYKISIVSSTWVDDILVKNGIGKAEMRFNSMLSYTFAFKSCVISDLYLPTSTVAQREMLTILLNMFDVSTPSEPSNPMIDSEVILTNFNITKISSETGLKCITFKELFSILSDFITKKVSKALLNGKEFVISQEIKEFDIYYQFIKKLLSVLGGIEVESFIPEHANESLLTIEHNIDPAMNSLKIPQRNSLFYIFDLWGLNSLDIDSISTKYKSFYHYPYLNIPSSIIDDSPTVVGLTNFFGYHKLFTNYFLKKMCITPSKFLSKKYFALIGYNKNGRKYEFAKSKNLKIYFGQDVERWYSKNQVDDFVCENFSQPYLTKKIDIEEYKQLLTQYYGDINTQSNYRDLPLIENIDQKTYTKEFALSSENVVTIIGSQTKNDEPLEKHSINDEFDLSLKFSSPSNKRSTSAADEYTHSNNVYVEDISVAKDFNNIEKTTISVAENELKSELPLTDSVSKKIKSPKRKLLVEQSETKKKTKSTKKDMTPSSAEIICPSYEQIRKTMDERISVAGGNNEYLTFQNIGERLNVILTGVDLKVDSTNTNFIYMSSIKNTSELYNTNMYILNKMGINVLENKDYKNCDCMIVGKKTAAFYESLSYKNIKHFLTFDFITSILEKVYKRKKNTDLNLNNYNFKEIGTNIQENLLKLGSKKLFESVDIDEINLLNPKNVTTSPDPKDSVFKAHGVKTVHLVNFGSDFDINVNCKSDKNNLVVIIINNSIKNVSPVMNKIKKQLKSNNSEKRYLIITWDFVMKSLLNMEIKLDSLDKGILLNTIM
ncbi:hypothetical protein QEN19_002483 [Hanseniaspora menglaensis]